MEQNISKISCQVLVVGGGVAGLRAAIATKEAAPDLKVLLVTKGILGRSGVTSVACSDRMAFHATLPETEPKGPDNWRYHAEDIYEIGGRVSDAHLATVLARNGGEAYRYLESIGVPFVKKGGRPHQFVTDGSDYPRALYTGPKTAVHIEEKLLEEFHRKNIDYMEKCQLCQIFTTDGSVNGALIIESEDNKCGKQKERLVFIASPSIIMATGGGGEIFADNVFPRGNSGDGFAAAIKAGAELVNMEFIQLGVASLKTKLNFSGSLMRAIPKVVNEKGEEILFKYFPESNNPMEIYTHLFNKGASWPVTFEHKTHIFDIIVYKERAAGHRVFFDYSANPTGFSFEKLDVALRSRYEEEIKEEATPEKRSATPFNRLKEINPDTVLWLKERGVDLASGEKAEVAVCAQHFQGGIKINSRGETGVPGLYAAGECAGGQHGANRPGGNALLDGQVFGKICAENAVSYVIKNQNIITTAPETEKWLEKINSYRIARGVSARTIRRKLQEIMSDFASVIRTEAGLLKGLEDLKKLKDVNMELDNNGLGYTLETEDMLIVAETVLTCALKRNESRGPHLRFEEYSNNEPIERKDPLWQKYLLVKREEDGNIKIEEKPPVSDYNFTE